MNDSEKYRSLADVYESGIPYNPDQGTFDFKPLSEAYTAVNRKPPVLNEAVGVSPILPEAVAAIAGIDSDTILNYYRSIDIDYVLTHVQIAIGSPSYRAINEDIHSKNFPPLASFVEELIKKTPEKPLIITTASKNKKLRSPQGGRICVWDTLEGMEDILRNPVDNPIETITKGKLNLLRCLAIIHLAHVYPSNIVQINKVPAGISYEADQIDSFNESLQGLPPLPIILPGSRDLYLDKHGKLVLINGAANVKGTPKADLALTTDGDEAFWVSFKHGKYVEDVKRSSDITFQQWGSHMGIYKQDDFKPLLDKYLTGVAEELGAHYTREQVEKMAPMIADNVEDGTTDFILKSVYNDHFGKKTKTGAYDKSSGLNKHDIEHIHVFKSGPGPIVNRLFSNDKKPLGSKLELLALKAIYGDDYSPTSKKMGKNNVNILLQTPESATFEVVTGTPDDPDEIWAVEMKMTDDAHIIKNPDLPHAIPYLPCLYTRYTYASPVVFTNTKTKRKEAIVGGRVLLYPQGKLDPKARFISVLD